MRIIILLFATVICGHTSSAYQQGRPRPKPHYNRPRPSNKYTDPVYAEQYVPFSWKMLEFRFPNSTARRLAWENGHLKPENAIPIDVQPYYYGKDSLETFVTIPRFLNGIPFTLARLSGEYGENGPELEAYPNYDFHNRDGKDCNKIISAFRVALTECNQLWVVDSGVIGDITICPPKLLCFDLTTDRLIHRFEFPQHLYTRNASLFVTPIVNVLDPPPYGRCRDTKVYVADIRNHGMVVYDPVKDDAWRVEHRFMYPDPDFGVHTIAGESFTLMDGVIGMTTDKKYLYFHAMASKTEYAVPLDVLNDKWNFENNVNGRPDAFIALGRRSSECAATASDSKGNVYCVTFKPIELLVWNVNTAYTKKNFRRVPINPFELQFVSGMKVVRNHKGKEELWLNSNRFQKLAASSMNFDETNFRIVVKSDRELGYSLKKK